mmetsp:Transcript_15258/g.27616  ORF Transcript_15258/g.27616 Transcript_15258/m.27616 type:complete len:277 (+) Transcript_15258:103-933(+)
MSENEQLLDQKDTVVSTSDSGTSHKTRTVHALLASLDTNDNHAAEVFLRRLWALLVFQYGTILFLSSPFALIDAFRESIAPYHNVLEVVAMSGIVASLCLAITKGENYPYAHVALVCLTLFVSLEMGLTFAHVSWGRCGLIALGQATAGFAVILGVLQFDSRSLVWLTYPTAALLCFCLSGLWVVVQAEAGVSWRIAAAVSLGGWVFTVVVLVCCEFITKHVGPEDYILSTLFILCPEILLFLASKERQPTDVRGGGDETKAGKERTEQQHQYGAV